MIYTLQEILNHTKGNADKDFDGNMVIKQILSDSRKVEGEGVMFVALSGDRFDGHTFVKEITKSGKNCAIIENEKYLCKNTVLVPDVRKALFDFANTKRESVLSNVKCVSVTGSVGKTSTKEYVNCVFSEKYNTYKSPGNQNSYTGLPMVILNCPENAEYMVLELGMSNHGEISTLSNLVKPNIGIVTNIGWSHSEYLGGRENILKEKLDITSGMNGGILVVNDDDDMLKKHINTNCTVIRCSTENKNADFYGEDIKIMDGKTYFTVNGNRMFVNQAGVHNAKNALLAYAAGIVAGIDENKVSYGLSKLPSDESRIKTRMCKNGGLLIEDCYNAAPESMKAALDYLKSQKGVKIAVLGDMLELGEFSPTLHKEVGEYAAECCDMLLCFGNFAEYIAEGATEKGHKNVTVFSIDEREKLVSKVKQSVTNETAILFKASNRMRFGDVVTSANL